MRGQADSPKQEWVLAAAEREKHSALLLHRLASTAWSPLSAPPLAVARSRSPASIAVVPGAVDLSLQQLYRRPLGWHLALARCSRAAVTPILAEFGRCFRSPFLHLDIHPCTARADQPTFSPPHSAAPAAAVGVHLRHLMPANLRSLCVARSPGLRSVRRVSGH